MAPVIGITASIDRRSAVLSETYTLARKYAEGVMRAGGVNGWVRISEWDESANDAVSTDGCESANATNGECRWSGVGL